MQPIDKLYQEEAKLIAVVIEIDGRWRLGASWSDFEHAKASALKYAEQYQARCFHVPHESVPEDMNGWIPMAHMTGPDKFVQFISPMSSTDALSRIFSAEVAQDIVIRKRGRGDNGIVVEGDPLAVLWRYFQAVIESCKQVIEMNDEKLGYRSGL